MRGEGGNADPGIAVVRYPRGGQNLILIRNEINPHAVRDQTLPDIVRHQQIVDAVVVELV